MPSRTCRGARRGAALGCAAAVMAALTACTATEAGTAEDDPAQVTTPAGPTTGPNTGTGVVITAFHVITEVSCTGQSAAVPASWSTRDAQAVSFTVDGQPLPAAAGYPVSGAGNVPVPCDGREHEIVLVATGDGRSVSSAQHVNTSSSAPPAGSPAITQLQVLADITCAGGTPVEVAASWTTQNAQAVSFAVDGQPLSAAAGFPVSGAGNVPVPCDGKAHKVTLTAVGAGEAQASLSRSVNTTATGPSGPTTAATPTR